MSFQVYDERIAFNLVVNLTNASGTSAVGAWTADTSTRRVDAITIVSDDTVDRSVAVNINISAADQKLVEVPVPAGSGTGIIPPVEVLKYLNLENLPAFVIGPSNTMRFNMVATLTAAKTVRIILWGGII
jgi:hypothetical protein